MNEMKSDTNRDTASKPSRPWGIAAAVGFATLLVLLVLLAVSESNGVGTAAGLVGIVSGICLGMWLVRTEPEPEYDPSTAGMGQLADLPPRRSEPGATTT